MEQKDRMMHNYIFNSQFHDLNPITVGSENCLPGKSFGPTIRKHILIHYVKSGSGTVARRNRSITVHAGEAFLIRPNEIVTYTADLTDPWHYAWVGFDGELSNNCSKLDDIIQLPEGLFDEMLEYAHEELSEYKIASVLFKMYAHLMSHHEPRHHYITDVKNYIRTLYMYPITVEEIAGQLNLDRRYLSRIFKQNTGKTIQEYLIDMRMKEAKNHLLNGESIEKAASLSGYPDPCNFSKMFKRKFGVSPLEWKKENSNF